MRSSSSGHELPRCTCRCLAMFETRAIYAQLQVDQVVSFKVSGPLASLAPTHQGFLVVSAVELHLLNSTRPSQPSYERVSRERCTPARVARVTEAHTPSPARNQEQLPLVCQRRQRSA